MAIQIIPFPLRQFRSPPSAGFWEHCMLSGGTQRRTLPRYQSEETKILCISFPRVEIEPTNRQVNSRTFVPLRHRL